MHLKHIGKKNCPQCGEHHHRVESLPNHPLLQDEIAALNDSESIEVVFPVVFMSGAAFGIDEEVAEDIVLATERKTRLIGFYENVGWVVDIEVQNDTEDDPRQVAEQLVRDARTTARETLVKERF